MGNFNWLAFSVASMITGMQEEKRRQKEKKGKFYQQCYEKIADISFQISDLIGKVSKRASKSYVPQEILDGITYHYMLVVW